MATELSLLSMSQIQSSRNIQHQGNPNPLIMSASYSDYVWNPRRSHLEDDDSWEVRAFAEDTRNVFGSTWPPRSYTCTFCRREFRSAQALGGHMNVHRRDRARLHQSQSQPSTSMNFSSSRSTCSYLLPTKELGEDEALCSLYQLPPASNTSPTTVSKATSGSTSSMFLSFSPFQASTVILPSSTRCPVSPTEAISSNYRYSIKCQEASSSHKGHEELDLELRL